MKVIKGFSKIVVFTIVAAFLIASSILYSHVLGDSPSPPENFYGTLTINGNPAPVGTHIKGYVGAEDKTSNPPYATAVAGHYGSDTFEGTFQVVCNTSDQITFAVEDSPGAGTFHNVAGPQCNPGADTNLDLVLSFSGQTCGDQACNGTETCSTCPQDCGTCPYCGDGSCNNGETCSTCPSDCGTCPSVCGNGNVETGETCELPNTSNNPFCSQSTSQCQGFKLGVRDALGNCNSTCGCVQDAFAYSCVKNSCGATCGSSQDCSASTCSQTYNDSCSGKKLVEYNSNKILDSTLVSNSTPNTCGTDSCACTSNPVTCSAPATNTYCVKNVCGAACSNNSDCDDGNASTTDTCLGDCTCQHTYLPSCGNGVIDQGETCELPNTGDNSYCSQTATQCLGTKLGTRDGFGNCNSACGCVPDSFVYSCVKDSCGATCSTNGDCNDQNPGTIDTCLDNCTCQHVVSGYCLLITDMKVLNATFFEDYTIPKGTMYNVRMSTYNSCDHAVTSMQIVQVLKGEMPVNLGTLTSAIEPGQTSVMTVGFIMPSSTPPSTGFTAKGFNWNHWIDQSPGTFQILSGTSQVGFSSE